jgi:predicted dehydrogenase
MTKVNTVIIGAGDIAKKRHIPAILQSENGELYGFYNRTLTSTQELAHKYDVKAYTSLEEVLSDPDVQAVLVSTPPDSHKDIANSALKAGKYVLLEKPMTLSVQEAREIVDAEKNSKAQVTMLHVQRYYAPHVKAKKLLESGEIGRLLTVRTYLGNADPRLLNDISYPAWESALVNVGIHRLDLLRWLIGSEVNEVFCHRSRLLLHSDSSKDADDADDHAVGILEFENGVEATIIASLTSFHGEDRSTVLIGTEGTITTYARSHELIVEKYSGEKSYYDFPSAHAQTTFELTDLHQRFFKSILEQTKPEVTAQDGLESVRLAAAMRQSHAERRWVKLSEIV